MPASLSVPLRASTGVDSFEMLFMNGYNFQKFDDICAVIGLLFVSKIVVVTVWDICVGFRAMIWSRLWKRNFAERYGGEWAVVTGCTDGIGKAYAHELARDGLKLVLVSRSMEKLQRVAKEIEAEHKVETEIVQVDFKNENIYNKIASHLEKKNISVLINNVGVMLGSPMPFGQCSWDDIQGHVNVNMRSVASMMKLVMPSMIEKKKGAVVNISSIAANSDIPYLGLYAASKIFVKYLSKATASEYSNIPGIHIQTVTPAYVSTNMISFNAYLHAPNPFTPTAGRFAACAVSTIGYTSVTTGYYTHGVMKWFSDKLPDFLSSFVMKYMQLAILKTMPHRD